MSESEIEQLLRKAPQPAAPAELKEQLRQGIVLRREPAQRRDEQSYTAPWWRRWIPALAFGMIFLTCFIMLAMQTNQIIQLRRDNQVLRAATAELAQLRQENQALHKARAQAEELERLRKENRELQQLRAEVANLQNQTAGLDQIRADNRRLQAEQAELRRRLPTGTAAEADPFAEARAKAMRIACVNNLKQIGLAARMWAGDNKDVLPKDFLTMSNELASPKILICRADAGRKPAVNWAEFTPQNVSYEMLSPGINDSEPEVVYARCPIHNNVGLVDGSVQQLGPEWQVTDVNGKKKITRILSPDGKPAVER